MRPCVWVVIATALWACAERTVTERERALERIPAESMVIAAADGTALSSPAFRQLLDSARPHLPASLGCVLDAATTSEAVAVGMKRDVGTTIVLVTRAVVARCPALSKIDDRVYTATIGAGVLAATRAASLFSDARWERARPYLLREPFALAVEDTAYRAIAVAQPDPLDAWFAIDSLDATATESTIKARVARYQAPPTIELAGKLAIARAGTQVTVQVEALRPEELTAIVLDLLRDADGGKRVAAPVFTCPPPGNGIISCHDGTKLKVTSVKVLLMKLVDVEATPIASGADIIGIRLVGEPLPPLRRDDVILGVGAHRVTSSRQLATLALTIGSSAMVAVRRQGVEVVLDLSE